LVKLAFRVCVVGGVVVKGEGRRRGEAVVVISNQRVTRKVVYGLETRGVPAYGAIFDS
jgi:ribosomal protein L14E/L6E/L27E